MPELPEVETVLRGLRPVMEGQSLVSVEQRRPDLRYAFPKDFVSRITGRRIVDLFRRAKYLVLELDSDECLIVHLGMSGRVTIADEGVIPKTHDHVVFHLSNEKVVIYNDARRFGFMDLWPKDDLSSYKSFRMLGPEPLGEEFTDGYLMDRLRGKTSPIKTALLDQQVVAGLGNIYVCEALFIAKIHPNTPAGNLDPARVKSLIKAVRTVLMDAIAAGGSTLRDHQQPNGDMGYFQHKFKVYGREGQPCYVCGAPIWKMTQAGRSTFYCSGCQST